MYNKGERRKMANNYETHYYNGDKFKIRFTDDGFSLDLRDDNFRGKLYDKDYLMGLTQEIKRQFKAKNGYELNIPDKEVSAEIMFHAGGYDFSEGLGDLRDLSATVAKSGLSIAAPWVAAVANKGEETLYNKFKTAETEEQDDWEEKAIYKILGNLMYLGK